MIACDGSYAESMLRARASKIDFTQPESFPDIQPLGMTVEEGIKMVVSGGIVTPPDRRAQRTAAEPDAEDAEVVKTA